MRGVADRLVDCEHRARAVDRIRIAVRERRDGEFGIRSLASSGVAAVLAL